MIFAMTFDGHKITQRLRPVLHLMQTEETNNIEMFPEFDDDSMSAVMQDSSIRRCSAGYTLLWHKMGYTGRAAAKFLRYGYEEKTTIWQRLALGLGL